MFICNIDHRKYSILIISEMLHLISFLLGSGCLRQPSLDVPEIVSPRFRMCGQLSITLSIVTIKPFWNGLEGIELLVLLAALG